MESLLTIRAEAEKIDPMGVYGKAGFFGRFRRHFGNKNTLDRRAGLYKVAFAFFRGYIESIFSAGGRQRASYDPTLVTKTWPGMEKGL